MSTRIMLAKPGMAYHRSGKAIVDHAGFGARLPYDERPVIAEVELLELKFQRTALLVRGPHVSV